MGTAMSTEHRGDLIASCGRCLIVDDNERFLAVAQDHLMNGGVDVVGTATNQADALRQAEALHPDIVLVDIRLGGESGFVLAPASSRASRSSTGAWCSSRPTTRTTSRT